jgi:hypothetical protein
MDDEKKAEKAIDRPLGVPGPDETHCTYIYDETTGQFTLDDPCTDAQGNPVPKCPDPNAGRVGNNPVMKEACFTNPSAHLWLVERNYGGATYGKAMYRIGTGTVEIVKLDGFTGQKTLGVHVVISKVNGTIKLVLACSSTEYPCTMQPLPTDPNDGP